MLAATLTATEVGMFGLSTCGDICLQAKAEAIVGPSAAAGWADV